MKNVAQEWFAFLTTTFWEQKKLHLHISGPVYISTAIYPKTTKNLMINKVFLIGFLSANSDPELHKRLKQRMLKTHCKRSKEVMDSFLLHQMDSIFTYWGPYAVLRNGTWYFEIRLKATLPWYISITHSVVIKQVT